MTNLPSTMFNFLHYELFCRHQKSVVQFLEIDKNQFLFSEIHNDGGHNQPCGFRFCCSYNTSKNPMI